MKVRVPETFYRLYGDKVLIDAQSLVEVIDYLIDEVAYEPGLSAMRNHLLQVQLKALREARHKAGS